MIIENSFEPTVFEKKFLKFNMNYCYFPLPWIKEPKDLKCNYINHIFFRVFGRYHSPYYKGIGEDINSAIKKGFA